MNRSIPSRQAKLHSKLLRVVLDTNILVSAAVTPGGQASRVLQQWKAGAFTLVTSEWILEELDRVLNSSKIQRFRPHSTDRMREFITLIRGSTLIIPLREIPDVGTDDKSDNAIFATAHASGAEFLVTGDPGVLAVTRYKETSIIRLRDFVARLDSETEHHFILQRSRSSRFEADDEE